MRETSFENIICYSYVVNIFKQGINAIIVHFITFCTNVVFNKKILYKRYEI